MTKNSDKRRKRFKSSASKKNTSTKTTTRKPKSDPIWDRLWTREAILAHAWVVADHIFDSEEAQLIDIGMTSSYTESNDNQKVFRLKNKDKKNVSLEKHITVPVGGISLENALYTGHWKDFVNIVVRMITGYSPIVDEWDSRYDSKAPDLRSVATKRYFRVKRLLEESIESIIYLRYYDAKKEFSAKFPEFRIKYLDKISFGDKVIDKTTLPYKTLHKCRKKQCHGLCFKSTLNKIKNRDEDGSNAAQVYLIERAQKHAMHNRMTKDIHNYALYGDRTVFPNVDSRFWDLLDEEHFIDASLSESVIATYVIIFLTNDKGTVPPGYPVGKKADHVRKMFNKILSDAKNSYPKLKGKVRR
jgi:hypothetical protein